MRPESCRSLGIQELGLNAQRYDSEGRGLGWGSEVVGTSADEGDTGGAFSNLYRDMLTLQYAREGAG